jgi:hypothetical protein
MMIYNQKEHEKWIARSKTDPACVLVLADFQHKRFAFIKGYDRWIND